MMPIAAILVLFLGAPAVMQSPAGLPDLETFFRNVQDNLRSDRLLQGRYTFNMKESKFETDEQGNPRVVEENEYEIFPYLDEDLTYRRHISKNGRPLSPEEIEKQDREHEKKLEERKKDLEKSGIDEETDYLEREKIERLKEDRIIGEIPLIYDIEMIGRETLEGRS
ncbi:MAG: hypothetical protein JW793_06895, partial [Acidobacteria bacterium]|nr:hypothetical protein [Acidobacteriota bacterium]